MCSSVCRTCAFVGIHGKPGINIRCLSIIIRFLKMYILRCVFLKFYKCISMFNHAFVFVYGCVHTQTRRECWMLWSWSHTQCEPSSFSSLFDGGSEDQDLSLNCKTRQFSKTSWSTSPKNPPASILPLSRY